MRTVLLGNRENSRYMSASEMSQIVSSGVKDQKTRYQTTTKLRPVNAASGPEQWAIRIIEGYVYDFKKSAHFACLEFCSCYWRCGWEPDLYVTRDFIALK